MSYGYIGRSKAGPRRTVICHAITNIPSFFFIRQLYSRWLSAEENPKLDQSVWRIFCVRSACVYHFNRINLFEIDSRSFRCIFSLPLIDASLYNSSKYFSDLLPIMYSCKRVQVSKNRLKCILLVRRVFYVSSGVLFNVKRVFSQRDSTKDKACTIACQSTSVFAKNWKTARLQASARFAVLQSVPNTGQQPFILVHVSPAILPFHSQVDSR